MSKTVTPDCPECGGKGGFFHLDPYAPADEWVDCATCCQRWRESDRKRKTVTVRYRNHRGEIAWRKIVPVTIEFKATEWHPQKQWLLKCLDLDKNAERDFAMADILEWKNGL